MSSSNRRRAALVAAAVALWFGYGAIRSLRPPHLHVPEQGAVLAHVTVINPRRDRRTDQTVTIRGDRIERIDDHPPAGRLHPLTRFLEHRYVLPGLIDMETTQPLGFPGLRQAFGVYFLANGVTTVRDVGNFDGDLSAFDRAIDQGQLAWPRLVACGRVLDDDPPRCGRSRGVRDASDARAAVDALAAAGAGCVRVRWALGADRLAAVHAAASARGLPVVGDLPGGAGDELAAPDDALLITAMRPPVPPGQQSDFLLGWSRFDPGVAERLVQSASRPGRTFTASLWPWLQLHRTVTGAGPAAAYFNFLPAAYRDVIWQGLAAASIAGFERVQMPADESISAALGKSLSGLHYTVRRLYEAGVRVSGGSGTPSPFVVPGIGVTLEMTTLAAAGVPLEDLWVAFTRSAGESLGIAGLGVIAPGAPADLLVFREDPTQTLAALSTLEAVVSQGRLYLGGNLLRAMLDEIRYFEHPLYDWGTRLAARAGWWGRGQELLDCHTP